MRFLLLLLVFCWAVMLIARVVNWLLRSLVNPPVTRQASPSQPFGGSPASDKLVRDPVCGVYITEARAIPLRSAGGLVHFCSAACRSKYAAQEDKLAANG